MDMEAAQRRCLVETHIEEKRLALERECEWAAIYVPMSST